MTESDLLSKVYRLEMVEFVTTKPFTRGIQNQNQKWISQTVTKIYDCVKITISELYDFILK